MPHTLTIEYGDDILFSLELTAGSFEEEARSVSRWPTSIRRTPRTRWRLPAMGEWSVMNRGPLVACRGHEGGVG